MCRSTRTANISKRQIESSEHATVALRSPCGSKSLLDNTLCSTRCLVAVRYTYSSTHQRTQKSTRYQVGRSEALCSRKVRRCSRQTAAESAPSTVFPSPYVQHDLPPTYEKVPKAGQLKKCRPSRKRVLHTVYATDLPFIDRQRKKKFLRPQNERLEQNLLDESMKVVYTEYEPLALKLARQLS